MPSGVNSLLRVLSTPPAVVKTSFMLLVRPTAASCLSKAGASAFQKLQKSRSGLACWMVATWEAKSSSPSLGNSSTTGLTSSIFPSAAIRLRTAWYDALLRRAIPREMWDSQLLHHRRERQLHAGRDAAQDRLDLVLEHQLAVPLDGVLGVGLLLEDQLDVPPEETSLLVDALGPPLDRTVAGLAGHGAGTRADDQDADLERLARGALDGDGRRRGGGRGRSGRGGRRRGRGRLGRLGRLGGRSGGWGGRGRLGARRQQCPARSEDEPPKQATTSHRDAHKSLLVLLPVQAALRARTIIFFAVESANDMAPSSRGQEPALTLRASPSGPPRPSSPAGFAPDPVGLGCRPVDRRRRPRGRRPCPPGAYRVPDAPGTRRLSRSRQRWPASARARGSSP